MPSQLVSVVVPSFNSAATIGACLRSILGQTHREIEILVCDDGSTDDTVAVARSLADERVTVLESASNGGASVARNRGIGAARGEVVFFTDADVEVEPDWICNGLRHFDEGDVMGIEGSLIYVSSNYSPSYSDRAVMNRSGGQYMTANAAYRRGVLLDVGGFPEGYRYLEDRELAMSVLREGRIVFAEDAVAHHMRESYTPRTYMREARKVGRQLCFEKEHDQRLVPRVGPIAYFSHLLTIVCPPLVLLRIASNRPRSSRDLLMFLLLYPRLLWERYVIWRWAVRNRTLVL